MLNDRSRAMNDSLQDACRCLEYRRERLAAGLSAVDWPVDVNTDIGLRQGGRKRREAQAKARK